MNKPINDPSSKPPDFGRNRRGAWNCWDFPKDSAAQRSELGSQRGNLIFEMAEAAWDIRGALTQIDGDRALKDLGA